jgi:hypothetical protein
MSKPFLCWHSRPNAEHSGILTCGNSLVLPSRKATTQEAIIEDGLGDRNQTETIRKKPFPAWVWTVCAENRQETLDTKNFFRDGIPRRSRLA